jgi:epoxyqueuosine reductase
MKAIISADTIKSFARQVGLEAVRITSAAPPEPAMKRVSLFAPDPGLHFEKVCAPDEYRIRCDPGFFFTGARSVLIAAESYLTSEPEDLSSPGDPHGLIARYTWRNYYRDTRERLKKLRSFICRELKRDVTGVIYSNGPLAEKPLAERSGIGYYGKHSLIIVPGYGSRVVLGELITDLDLPEDHQVPGECNDCRRCLDACPTGALRRPYIIDRSICIQYLSSWKKMLPVTIRRAWGKRIYGCSICQDACPLNQRAIPAEKHPPYGDIGPSYPLLPLLQMTPEEYRHRFRGNQMGASWVDPAAVRRNACIALGNCGDPAGVKPLGHTINDPEYIIRAHSAWALGRIGGVKAKSILERAFSREVHPAVSKEIEDALSII